MGDGNRVIFSSRVYGLQNAEIKPPKTAARTIICGRDSSGAGLVGWIDEMGVSRFGGMPYRKEVEEELAADPMGSTVLSLSLS